MTIDSAASWGILRQDESRFRDLQRALASWSRLRGGKTINKEIVWFPKPSTSLTDMRGKLQVALELQEVHRRDGGNEYFAEDEVASELARRGAITRPSVPVDRTIQEYEDEQVANQPHISSFRMQNRIFRLLGWTTRRLGSRNHYVLTRRGLQICKFTGPFPGRIGTLSERDLVIESMVNAIVFSVGDNIGQWDTRFKQRIAVNMLRCASRFGFVSNNELVVTAFALKDERDRNQLKAMIERLERLHNGRTTMPQAFREVGVDPAEKSAVTGAYDGPKVLTSLCRQCGLFEPTTRLLKDMDGRIEHTYEIMHREKSQVMLPRVVNVISDLGRQLLAKEATKLLLRFEDLA